MHCRYDQTVVLTGVHSKTDYPETIRRVVLRSRVRNPQSAFASPVSPPASSLKLCYTISMSTSLKELLEKHTIPGASALTHREEEGALRCLACGHRCLIREGRAGICKVRFNRDGELCAPGGYVAGLQIDPIEKKPFFHAFPGREALSFGMLGCDLHCSYCQNWVSSQVLRDERAVAYPHFCEAHQIVEMAVHHDSPVIVSTYNEPLITADWAMRIFSLAREHNIICGFVSNGNASPEVLDFLRPCVSLYKVDLKTFNDANYHHLGCTLKAVLDTIQRLKAMGFWVEIVTLIVPGFNDSPEELQDIAQFIASVSPDIPWHVTAFHPDYKMNDRPRTRIQELDRAYDAGKDAGLHYIYQGNLSGSAGDRENTYCPQCHTLLIARHGFYVLENTMKGNACPNCAAPIPGVWETNPPRRSQGNGLPRPVAF